MTHLSELCQPVATVFLINEIVVLININTPITSNFLCIYFEESVLVARSFGSGNDVNA